MYLNEIEDTLWNAWIKNLKEYQKSPYIETIDVEITPDTLNRILNGEWYEICDEIEHNNLDWFLDQYNIVLNNAWDDVLNEYKTVLNNLDLEDEDNSLNELLKIFKYRLEEKEPDLTYGYVKLNFSTTGDANIRINIDYNGLSTGTSWFEELTNVGVDNKEQTVWFFKPKKDFIGFLTLLNISKDDFSNQLMLSDWLDTVQKEQFSEALASAYQTYTQEFGLPLLDTSTPSSVTPKKLVDWFQKLFKNKEELLNYGLYTTIKLSGKELDELANNLAIAKNNASNPLELEHMMKVWLEAGAKLYDAEDNVSEPLELDAPLLLSIKDQFEIDRYYDGEEVKLTFPVIESLMAEQKIKEWMHKEIEEGIDYSEQIKRELYHFDFTPEMKVKKSTDFLDRIRQFGLEMRDFDERDLRFPPNPAVLEYFASVEGRNWKTKNGTTIAHALWSAFPQSTVREFINAHNINLFDKDKFGNTIVHLAAFVVAKKTYYSDLSNTLSNWLNQATIQIQNNEGVTPLDILICSNHKELSKNLIKALDNAEVNWVEPNVTCKGKTLAQRFCLDSHPFVQRQQLQKSVSETLNDKSKDIFTL